MKDWATRLPVQPTATPRHCLLQIDANRLDVVAVCGRTIFSLP